MSSSKFLTFAALSALTPILLASATQAAGPVPVAPAFKLSGCATCRQSNPRLAGTPNGKLITAFDIELIPPAPVVQARVFPATGVAPKAFRPQASLTPAQYDAAVAANKGGAFVVAWSTVDTARNSDIFVQRYGSDAKPVGATLPVSLDPAGVQVLDTAPSVAIGSDGAFTVAWIRIVPQGQPDPTGPQIWARRYSATGIPAGPPLKVADTLIGNFRPSVCVDTSGKSIFVFATIDQDRPFESSKIGVSMRRMGPKGLLNGGVVVVAPALGYESHPVVSCGLAGAFVIAWESNQAPVTTFGNIVAQRYNANAARVGSPFIVSATADRQRTPAIAHDAEGNFVIVWQGLGSSLSGIYGQRFSPTGAALGARFTVTEAEFASTTVPTVAAAGAADAFAVAWRNLQTGLFARRFKIVK